MEERIGPWLYRINHNSGRIEEGLIMTFPLQGSPQALILFLFYSLVMCVRLTRALHGWHEFPR